jgi:hypothetical protein
MAYEISPAHQAKLRIYPYKTTTKFTNNQLFPQASIPTAIHPSPSSEKPPPNT